jgi:hypothetical protein
MNVKYYFALILLGFGLSQLRAADVAQVGQRYISEEELTDAISLLQDGYDEHNYSDKREKALDNLIEEKLLLQYADDNKIVVSDKELDAYFIAQFNNHPQFSTDGIFDEYRFKELKYTPKVQAILRGLREELLIFKTKEILRNMFRASDTDLLDRYILERSHLTLSYALVKQDKVNLPYFVDPSVVKNYYINHERDFQTPKGYIAEYCFIPFGKFTEKARIVEAESDEYLAQPSDDQTHLALINEKAKQLARIESNRIKQELENGSTSTWPNYEQRIYDQPYREHNNNGVLERYNIISKLKSLSRGEYSEPFETDLGYLIYRWTDNFADNKSIMNFFADKIWTSYHRNRTMKEYAQIYHDYYRDHLHDYSAPAAEVTILGIDLQKLEETMAPSNRELEHYYDKNKHRLSIEEQKLPYFRVREKIKRLYFDDLLEKKREWCKKNILHYDYTTGGSEDIIVEPGVSLYSRLIFLAKLSNQDTISELVKQELVNNMKNSTGTAENGQVVVYYRLNRYYPEYTPSFDQLQDLIPENVSYVEEEVNFEEYYKQWVNNLIAPDKVSLKGVFIPIEPDTSYIDEDELISFYQQNEQKYRSEAKIAIEYFFIRDAFIEKNGFIGQISRRIENGEDIVTLNYCLGEDLRISQQSLLSIHSLPQELISYFSNLPLNKIGEPLYFNDGWFIGKKVEETQSSTLNLEQALPLVEIDYRLVKADEVAKEKAMSLFNSVRNIKDLDTFTEKAILFTTKLTAVDQEFDIIGNISEYAQRLVLLKKNEKFNTLLSNSKGYGVIFLLDKSVNQRYSFAEALPIIKEQLRREQIAQNSQKFASQLRELIVSGRDPQEVMIFYGSWIVLKDIELDKQIPGVKDSSLIIQDAIRKNKGYVSPLIEIADGTYMFYRVEDKRIASREEFYLDKYYYSEEIIDREYRNWLSDYAKRIGVEKY